MKYHGVRIAVSDINVARKLYEDLFGLEVYQDYGINVSFLGGLSLQQEFDWLLGVPKNKILKEANNMELYFEEDNFDSFVASLKDRDNIKYIRDGIKEAEWGQRSARFYDLDRHIIEVGENMKTVARRFLDLGMSMDKTSRRTGMTILDLERILNS